MAQMYSQSNFSGVIEVVRFLRIAERNGATPVRDAGTIMLASSMGMIRSM